MMVIIMEDKMDMRHDNYDDIFRGPKHKRPEEDLPNQEKKMKSA